MEMSPLLHEFTSLIAYLYKDFLKYSKKFLASVEMAIGIPTSELLDRKKNIFSVYCFLCFHDRVIGGILMELLLMFPSVSMFMFP